MASGGYPGNYRKGLTIDGPGRGSRSCPTPWSSTPAPRAMARRVLTAGGRVLGVTAWADDLPAAIDARLCGGGSAFTGQAPSYRHDIGAKGLLREG